MGTSTELISAVRAAAAGTPYAVRETPQGFDLTIDVADAQWLAVFKAHGLKKVFTHKVALNESNQSMTITDVSNTFSWSGGGSSPRLQASGSTQRGRVYEKSFKKELGVDLKTGEVGQVVDYSFDATAGRDLVRDVAKQQGWDEKMGGTQKGAVIFAGATVAILAVAGIVWLVVSLL
ncbi:hypothetical protein SAMN04489867_0242 [Pedococcus dokdonensis]|uniref:Uncharacterized protein n=1 Tax=Pedococcus dokdonensis TaxID=443156 RepID=A0A1H0LAV9_9MICO|nr:hypothetical protein [Pedococcus dokdonensis]SDO65265.1 hypothetical protein SAMN04489867_0242 [Pedococcus dokdonensis]